MIFFILLNVTGLNSVFILIVNIQSMYMYTFLYFLKKNYFKNTHTNTQSNVSMTSLFTRQQNCNNGCYALSFFIVYKYCVCILFLFCATLLSCCLKPTKSTSVSYNIALADLFRHYHEHTHRFDLYLKVHYA